MLFLPWKIYALTLSPPIFDLKALPGEVITASLVLENETDAALNLFGEVEAFNSAAKEGEAEFYPSREGLPSWIELSEKEISLAPKESKRIVLKISVPKEAAGGSYYAAAFWGAAPSGDASSGAAVASRLGALIFLRVNGAIAEELELLDFRAVKKINTSLPAIFETKIKNNGNVYLAPKGEIVIKTWTGKNVATIPWNEAGARVLPGTTRTIEAKFGNPNFWEEIKYGIFGFYRASVLVSYGSPTKELGDFASFWILPFPNLIIVTAALILFILAIRFGIRRYNRWVIKKHFGS